MNTNFRGILLAAGTASFLMTFITLAIAEAQEKQWLEQQTEWNGFQQFHFTIAERPAYIVSPTQPAAGKPWVWRARFPNYHAEMDIKLLAKGYTIAYIDVGGMFGSPQAIKIGDEFYNFLTTTRGLATRPAMEGVSRGGLFVYNWAATHPEKVACIYCDTPVCDIKSWPGGMGAGLGSPETWQQCLAAFGIAAADVQKFTGNPVDRSKVIANAKIPILHIVSENDRVVPPVENTYALQEQLKHSGHSMEIISVAEGTAKSNGHHFTHPDPDRVVRFIDRQNRTANRMAILKNARRVIFLGDSITYAGDFVTFFDTWMLTRNLTNSPVLINAGLPSETVSGLSEEGHAGGKFPRPGLDERLARILTTTKPDLVFACYGINCGIYQPFDEERFQRFRNGIENLRNQVEKTGARLILITPPCYDDFQANRKFSYNSVLDRYSQWLYKQNEKGWQVIDLHNAMTKEVEHRRQSNPDFTFQKDAVHPNSEGHWFIASQLIRWFGDDNAADSASPAAMLENASVPQEILGEVRQRMILRRNANLTAAGHQRPGIPTGIPLEEASLQAEKLSAKIQQLYRESRR